MSRIIQSALLIFLAAGASTTVADDRQHGLQPSTSSTRAEAPPAFACRGPLLSDEQFKAVLKKTYTPFIRTIRRPVYLYHYGWRTPRPKESVRENGYDDSTPVPATGTTDDFTGPVEPNPTVIHEGRPIGLAELFFRRKAGARATAEVYSSYGPGLYTGMDPVGGIVYSRGLLLRVGVPAGTKVLDIREFGDFKRLPLPADAAEAFQCTLRSYYDTNPFLDPSNSVHLVQMLEAPRARRLEGEVLKELGIAAIQPDLHQAVFVNPEIAPKLDLAILVPAVEKNPSAEKRRVYGEVLPYFDAVDFSGAKDRPFSSEFVERTALPKFWEQYRSWAGALRGLPPDTDWMAYQREQSAKWSDPAMVDRKLTSKLYGRSKEYPEEYEPWLRR